LTKNVRLTKKHTDKIVGKFKTLIGRADKAEMELARIERSSRLTYGQVQEIVRARRAETPAWESALKGSRVEPGRLNELWLEMRALRRRVRAVEMEAGQSLTSLRITHQGVLAGEKIAERAKA